MWFLDINFDIDLFDERNVVALGRSILGYDVEYSKELFMGIDLLKCLHKFMVSKNPIICNDYNNLQNNNVVIIDDRFYYFIKEEHTEIIGLSYGCFINAVLDGVCVVLNYVKITDKDIDLHKIEDEIRDIIGCNVSTVNRMSSF